jgi:hypothetical protein
VEFHANALVLILFLDSCALDRFAVGENAVIPFDLADGPNCLVVRLCGHDSFRSEIASKNKRGNLSKRHSFQAQDMLERRPTNPAKIP